MILQKYESYKDSGVEWLGEIPEGWEVKRIKDICELNPMTSKKISVQEAESIEFLPMSQVDEIRGVIKKYLFEKYEDVKTGYTSFKNEDILFAKITPCMENGNCVIVKGLKKNLGFGSTEFIIFRANSKYQRFLYLFLRNKRFLEKAEFFMTGSAGQKRISTSYLEVQPICIPTKHEQIQISDFLDTKTSQIDSKIKVLQDKITCYEELKKTLINETVCRGLNKDVGLKDTEIEWIEKIPKHWRIDRNKNLFYESKKVSKTGKEDLLSVSEYTGVTIKGKDEETGENNSRADSLEEYKICSKGDLVINIMLAWKTGLGVSPFFGIVSPAYGVYSPKSKISPEYYHYLFRTDMYTAEFRRSSTGIISSRLRLYSDKFFAIHSILPPKPEQIQIAKYLDEKTSKIDKIISKIDEQVNTLTEFRKTLINDVVTGKVRVST